MFVCKQSQSVFFWAIKKERKIKGFVNANGNREMEGEMEKKGNEKKGREKGEDGSEREGGEGEGVKGREGE